MEVERVIRRSSISGRSEEANNDSFTSPILDRAKLATTPSRSTQRPQPRLQQQQQQQFKSTTMKMFNKVQVVYYLTRNGQLEHPHFIEVSHLATQPLRLKDVTDRLTTLRGKAMPCQYSWSCKRSYKNGYVWNDLTENDVIYACEGSEYVLKGSEIIHHIDFSEVGRLEDQQIRKQNRGRRNTNGLVTNKSNTGTTQVHHNYRQVSTIQHSKQEHAVKNYDQTENHNDDDDENEDEEKGSCNSSNAPYSSMQIEQEESFSFPSTSSTNSDKQPPPVVASESKRYEKEAARLMIQEDGDTTISTSLARNSTTLLHLMACGGGGIVGPNKSKSKSKGSNNNGSSSSRSLNLRMKNSFMPCLKQQLSSRDTSTSVPPRLSKDQRHNDVDDHYQVVSKEEHEDEDMMMVRFMSENPRFGNLQSEEKEYFSGTIVEAMTTTTTNQSYHHDHSPVSACTQPPVLTKSSSYNEHTRSSKGGLQAEAAAAAAASRVEDKDDDEKEDAKVKGMIKLCIPRKKSLSSSSTSTKHTC